MTPTDRTSTRLYFLLGLILLGLILLAGLTLRTWNVRFDDGIGSHPDERSTACFYAPSIAMPASWDEFEDPHASPLNPLWDRNEQRRRSFTYGHFPLYLGVATGEILHSLAPIAEALPLSESVVSQMRLANSGCEVTVAGRLLMALLDTLTIFLLFLLGRRLFGPETGLLTAALYAFTAQAIQLSHFFAMDPASTTFTVLAVYGAVLMAQDRSWRGVLIAGIGAGLAISSKFSALPILAAPFTAALVVGWQASRAPSSRAQEGRDRILSPSPEMGRRPEPVEGERRGGGFGRLFIGAVFALLLAVITFAITSPYAILDWQNFIQATLVEQGAMVRGLADFPFTRQYRNTTPYLYFIQQQVVWGMGLPLGLAALAGTLWALVRLAMGRATSGEWIVWSWLIPYFGLTGAFLAKFNRYMSPVLPFVVLFAAAFSLWLIGKLRTPNHPITQSPTLPLRILGWGVAAIALLGALFWSTAYVNGVYNHEHTWLQASRWVYANAPRDSIILWELWDDPLPKSVPNAPGLDMGSAGLRHIDWSPYEEDTAEKYEILKAKLREADFVIYSSKRIYGSVDELPERYPLTTRYYDLMFGEQLGFRHAVEVTSPPRLFGFDFPDDSADESWSLYDHPQVSIFQKERDLSDAEYDALLGGSWVGAQPWYRGKDSPLSPLLELVGLGNAPDSEKKGLINAIVALVRGEDRPDSQPSLPPLEERADLSLGVPLNELPLVDNYRWNVAASESPWLAVGWWWLVLSLLGLVSWPIGFLLLRRLRDRGYLFSKSLGWLLAGWLLWLSASVGVAQNTVTNAWLVVVLLGIVGVGLAIWHWREMKEFLARMWPLLLVGEALFALAFVFFVLLRMLNPDIWQPWFGGEKFMEFAFLNGILRSPTFPPVDPHFAGGYINYYYFGIYLVAYLVKLTGIYAEVAFNLAISSLFALTIVNAFGVAYSAVAGGRGQGAGRLLSLSKDDGSPANHNLQFTIHHSLFPSPDETEPAPMDALVSGPVLELPDLSELPVPEDDFLDIDLRRPAPAPLAEALPEPITESPNRLNTQSPVLPITPPARKRNIPPPQHPPAHWRVGILPALLAPLFVALLGNLDGFAQIVRRLLEMSQSNFQSAIPGVQTAVRAASGLWHVLTTDAQLPGYNFWDPSRVIPYTINEFPYWSFTFADLHPHMIGIPFSVLFLGLVLSLLGSYDTDWRREWGQGLLMLGGFGLLLGTLASINLWELPTYFGLGVLALAISLYRGRGRLNLLLLGGVSVGFLAAAYLLFLPFFRNFHNVGASGVGAVREPDDLGVWLLIWGFFAFVIISWLLRSLRDPARSGDAPATGLERWLALAFGNRPFGNRPLGSRPFENRPFENRPLENGERLPRLLYWQSRLVRWPTLGFSIGLWWIPFFAAVGAGLLIFTDQKVLGLCVPFLAIGFLLLWRRGRAADPGALLAALLAVTGFAILAGTQIIYLKDFLQGGDWYRMNTLFKFFIQVWVLWGIAAAVALPRMWNGGAGMRSEDRSSYIPHSSPLLRPIWTAVFALLFVASLAYPLWGTPARLDQRLISWSPPIGTLNGLDYMNEGVYTWPNENNRIELRYDREAITWLLDNIRGNLVVAESSTLEYYRAGGSRVASMTGLSGVSGMHEGEQRWGELVGERNALLGEFWNTGDPGRTRQLIDELDIALIYVGQLEMHEHPQAAAKLAQLVTDGTLSVLYSNDRVTIYAVAGRLVQLVDGQFAPAGDS